MGPDPAAGRPRILSPLPSVPADPLGPAPLLPGGLPLEITIFSWPDCMCFLQWWPHALRLGFWGLLKLGCVTAMLKWGEAALPPVGVWLLGSDLTHF